MRRARPSDWPDPEKTAPPVNAPVSVAHGAEDGHHHEGERYQVGVGAARHENAVEEATRPRTACCGQVRGRMARKQKTAAAASRKRRRRTLVKQILPGPNILPKARCRHRSLQRTPR